MTVKNLRLADDLSIPAEEFIQSATAIIGKRKSGKSGTVKVLEEELYRVGLPFVTLDPVGVHWGIRTSYDGKSPSGLEVVVFGGKHADVPLDRRGGAAVARAVVEGNFSCVIDFSQESKSVFRQFVGDFCRELYAKNESPRVVIIEEAPELVPQKHRPDMAETFEAVERLITRGRNNNIGVVVVSQRAATIDKDVLTQLDNLLVGRLLSPQDRKALREWVEAWDVKERLPEFEAGLASLPTRTLWLWSPETLGKFQPVHVRTFKTLHADKTHLNRLGLLAAKPVMTDVTAVVAKLGQEMERLAKKVDVAEVPRLRARIAALEAEKARASSPSGETRHLIKRAVEEATMPLKNALEAHRQALGKANRILGVVRGMGVKLAEVNPVELPPSLNGTESPAAVALRVGVSTAPSTVTHGFRFPPSTFASPPRPPRAETMSIVGYRASDPEAVPIKSGARRMLQELASRHPLTLTYAQLATLAGFTPSGGTATTYYGVLRRVGYLTADQDGSLHVTDAGMEYLGADVPPAPTTHADIMERWRHSLKAGTYRILEEVVKVYPVAISADELGELTGFAASGGTFTTYLGILVRNGLVEKRDGMVKATGVLFP